jgi:hypothetical protein
VSEELEFWTSSSERSFFTFEGRVLPVTRGADECIAASRSDDTVNTANTSIRREFKSLGLRGAVAACLLFDGRPPLSLSSPSPFAKREVNDAKKGVLPREKKHRGLAKI